MARRVLASRAQLGMLHELLQLSAHTVVAQREQVGVINARGVSERAESEWRISEARLRHTTNVARLRAEVTALRRQLGRATATKTPRCISARMVQDEKLGVRCVAQGLLVSPAPLLEGCEMEEEQHALLIGWSGTR